MVISFKSRRNKKQINRRSTFLFFPLFFNGKIFWLERVIIKKSFNGYRLITSDVVRTKHLIRRQSKDFTTITPIQNNTFKKVV